MSDEAQEKAERDRRIKEFARDYYNNDVIPAWDTNPDPPNKN